MGNTQYIPRQIEGLVRDDLGIFPVVLLQGARQVGKTTMAKKICDEAGGAYLSLDDDDTRATSVKRPSELVALAEKKGLVVIDEIQLNPELMYAVKMFVDDNRRPGMFLLTGSGNRTKMDREAQKLTGRSSSVFMHPLSQREIRCHLRGDRLPGPGGPTASNDGASRVGIVNAMIDGNPPGGDYHETLEDIVHQGGYPACIADKGSKDRWLSQYYRSGVELSIRQVTKSDAIRSYGSFMSHVSAKLGKQVNVSDIARTLAESEYAVRTIVGLLADAFVLDLLYGHRRKISKRGTLAKPKLYLNDTGLATSLLGLGPGDVTDSPHWGALVENLVLNELRKDLDTNHPDDFFSVNYFAERNGVDIDFVLDCGPTNGMIPIEVKASRRVWSQDIRNVYEFKEKVGKRCRRAYVLYGGDEVVDFIGGIQAWPISSLWSA